MKISDLSKEERKLLFLFRLCDTLATPQPERRKEIPHEKGDIRHDNQ